MSQDRFVELYRTYGRVVYARCWRILGDEAAAADASQETFLRVYRHLERAPGSAEALAWIYRIATNYCLNQLRNRRARAERPLDSTAHGPEAAAAGESLAGPGVARQRRLEELVVDRDLVLRVLARVPEKVALAAWLHHVDGIDQGEVAGVLGVSRRTVVYRLAEFAARARQIIDGG